MSQFLGGLTPGGIPVAGTKRRSFGAQLGGQVYRIGRVWANRAFVVVRGNLRLLYVARDYANYAEVARRVFDRDGRRYDYDHVLGRAICRKQGFDYILVARLGESVNRSYGWSEQPCTAGQTAGRGFIILDKFCFADERIFNKMLGVPFGVLPRDLRSTGYALAKQHDRRVTPVQARRLRHALGMARDGLDLRGLTPILR